MNHRYYQPRGDSMRVESGNLSGEIIQTIRNGEFITVLEKGTRETIDGITSMWIRVRMNDGTEGCCFGGYIEYP